MMLLFRFGSRQQIKHQLRCNGPSQTKFGTWFEIAEVPHGDTLNYAFMGLIADEIQEVVCRMVARLIRKKVLYCWRLFDNLMITVDSAGMLTFRERHCDCCLTKKLYNGEMLYYHLILEAKLVTANGLPSQF